MDLHSSPSDLVTMVKTAAQEESLMTCATPVGVSRPGLPLHASPRPGVFSHWFIQLGKVMVKTIREH